MAIAKPDGFPEELWEYVEPRQRLKVPGRYAQYKSESYLKECLGLIMTKLDIQPREEFYTPNWFVDTGGKSALQEHFVRAQALANPQAYFFPDPDEIPMAKDVIADVVTTNEKPFKSRPRKYSNKPSCKLKLTSC
jgi:hypothetical protein